MYFRLIVFVIPWSCMATNDEFADIRKSNLSSSLKSSLILIVGIGLFVVIIYVLINMVTTWSQKIGRTDRPQAVETVQK